MVEGKPHFSLYWHFIMQPLNHSLFLYRAADSISQLETFNPIW